MSNDEDMKRAFYGRGAENDLAPVNAQRKPEPTGRSIKIPRDLADRIIDSSRVTHNSDLQELRALLAAPAVERQAEPVCIYWDAKTQDCLDKSPPAPVSVPEGWKLVPIEPTEAMLNVLHDRVLISVNSRKQEANILNDKAWWRAVVESSPACLDKVKELNP